MASAAPAIPAVKPEVPCRNHPGRLADTLCARCADFLCALCAIRLEGTDYCPSCATRVRADVMQLGSYIPWEDRARLGTVKAATDTIAAAFSRPQEFMERMPLQGGVTEPLLFGMLLRGVVVIVYAFIVAAFYVILGIATGEATMFLQAGIQIGSIFFNVIYAAALLFMLAGLIHLGVVVASGTRGFEATFRVYTYGRAVDVLDLIPILGPFAAMGYRVYLYYLGLKHAHDLSPTRALLCALLPIFVGVFLMMFLFGMIIVIVLLLI